MATLAEREKVEANRPEPNMMPEAVVVDMCDGGVDGHGRPSSEQYSTPPVASYEYPPSSQYPPSSRQPYYHPAVRDNRACQCCYPITVADPAEMVPARQLAISQVCLEVLGFMFCRSQVCVVATLLFGIPIASVVACCSKNKTSYTIWGVLSGMASWMHMAAGVSAFTGTDTYDSGSPIFTALVQVVLCLVAMAGMVYGFKISSLLRETIHPVAREADLVEAPVLGSAIPTARLRFTQANLVTVPCTETP